MAVQTSALPSTRAGTRPSRKQRPRSDWRIALAFLVPAAIGLVVFYIWPALRGLYFSFTTYQVLTPPEWVGGENYSRMFDDPLFWNALWVTAYYVLLNIGIQTLVAIAIAVLLHRLTRSTVIRGIALLPYFVANVIIALVWFFMLDFQIGIVNVALDTIGLDRMAFFGDPALAIPTIALINVWRHMGYTALLLFAGMQMINPQLYEAARVDGASELRQFFSLTLPLLRPVLAMVLIVTITGSFQVFDTVAVTTGGGPANATRVLNMYIYDLAWGQLDFGYASALAVALFVLLFTIAFVQLRLMRAGESDEN
ncbi:binding-protein-dependent transport systems inner membrane component [Beutenbergia cavernae DSM 12333]|uniref:Binding-protein-dependent transport systems inner membrane component n=1 Tax=Beutenbergia cavernae (strain ATCC BAA-8 / DSM 12333 / CCUG 43141 / JCM 11478 / NBRC 16432 / NCIMB 13614 / HKI 0122) TaxID=471853 RepID=C5BYG2_BEUC1|nr:sugar ABC transporter permease [Beutenbergia cavernae]ACQ81062.1 binding-protein-dependent transport systems inner membrane component [Beutenbergia cavernae DSM 12333]